MIRYKTFVWYLIFFLALTPYNQSINKSSLYYLQYISRTCFSPQPLLPPWCKFPSFLLDFYSALPTPLPESSWAPPAYSWQISFKVKLLKYVALCQPSAQNPWFPDSLSKFQNPYNGLQGPRRIPALPSHYSDLISYHLLTFYGSLLIIPNTFPPPSLHLFFSTENTLYSLILKIHSLGSLLKYHGGPSWTHVHAHTHSYSLSTYSVFNPLDILHIGHNPLFTFWNLKNSESLKFIILHLLAVSGMAWTHLVIKKMTRFDARLFLIYIYSIQHELWYVLL